MQRKNGEPYPSVGVSPGGTCFKRPAVSAQQKRQTRSPVSLSPSSLGWPEARVEARSLVSSFGLTATLPIADRSPRLAINDLACAGLPPAQHYITADVIALARLE
jgi:hypothetical protein